MGDLLCLEEAERVSRSNPRSASMRNRIDTRRGSAPRLIFRRRVHGIDDIRDNRSYVPNKLQTCIALQGVNERGRRNIRFRVRRRPAVVRSKEPHVQIPFALQASPVQHGAGVQASGPHSIAHKLGADLVHGPIHDPQVGQAIVGP